MTTISLYIIILSVFILIYTFFLYPALIFIISKLKRNIELDDKLDNYPKITVVLSVYNEENFVEEAIRTVFSTDYPRKQIRLLIGSDGSSDKTDEIVDSLLAEFPEVEFHKYGRSGKNMVLNNLLKDNIQDEYIFYMDADCRLEKDTIIKLVSALQDNKVGAVIAAMHSLYANDESEDTGGKGEGLYQRYETALKKNESHIFSTVASCGLFYGMKAKYYIPLPNPNLCDDLFPLITIATKKKRILYLADAIAYEYREKSLGNEFQRRSRIIAGAHATIANTWKILLPQYGWYSFAFWSHKVLRYYAPFFMLFILLLTGFIYNNFLFYPLLLIQLFFYGFALLGKLLSHTNLKIPLLKVCYYFVSQNIAIFIGFFKFLSSKNISQWNTTENTQASSSVE